MGLKKGIKNNPNGRPKGSKNEKSKQWEKIVEAMSCEFAERFLKIMKQADDETFAELYIATLKYHKPTYASQSVTIDKPEITAIEFIVKK